MHKEAKLARVVAKKAKAFFESLADMLDDYLKETGGAAEPLSKSKKKSTKKSKTTKAEKHKPEVDADAPKKPLTAFMLYCAHRRSQMKAIDPCIVLSWYNPKIAPMIENDRLKIIGEEWNKMSQIDQEQWKEKARKEKLRYDAEMLKYKQRKEANEGKKGKKKKMDMEQGELKPLIEISPESEENANAKHGRTKGGASETPKKA